MFKRSQFRSSGKELNFYRFCATQDWGWVIKEGGHVGERGIIEDCGIFISQEPAVQGGLNRAPGAPVVKTAPSVLTAVQKLLHLAEVEGFRVQFTDYPKVSLIDNNYYYSPK